MSPFVLLALAFALIALCMVGVAAVILRRAVAALAQAGREAGDRITPLAEELQAEQAVAQLEIEAIQRTREAGRSRRAPRPPTP